MNRLEDEIVAKKTTNVLELKKGHVVICGVKGKVGLMDEGNPKEWETRSEATMDAASASHHIKGCETIRNNVSFSSENEREWRS